MERAEGAEKSDLTYSLAYLNYNADTRWAEEGFVATTYELERREIKRCHVEHEDSIVNSVRLMLSGKSSGS
jgi:hypothetical protein